MVAFESVHHWISQFSQVIESMYQYIQDDCHHQLVVLYRYWVANVVSSKVWFTYHQRLVGFFRSQYQLVAFITYDSGIPQPHQIIVNHGQKLLSTSETVGFVYVTS